MPTTAHTLKCRSPPYVHSYSLSFSFSFPLSPLQTCTEAKEMVCLYSSLPHSFKTDSLPKARLADPWAPRIPVSAPQCWGHRHAQPCSDFYFHLGEGDLNSGPSAFTVSTPPHWTTFPPQGHSPSPKKKIKALFSEERIAKVHNTFLISHNN